MTLAPRTPATRVRSVNPAGDAGHGFKSPPIRDNQDCGSAAEEIFSSEALPAPQGYPAGIDLYQQGWRPREVFVIKSGAVKLGQTDDSGRQVIAGLRTAGHIVGVASAYLDQPYPETATTIDKCEIIRLPQAMLVQQINSNGSIADYVLKELCRDYYQHTVYIERFQAMTAKERVMHILLQLSNAEAAHLPAGGVRVPPILRDWEIAQFAGLSPQRYSQLLSELVADGLIRRQKRLLTIISAKSLETGRKTNGKTNGNGTPAGLG